MGKLIWYSFLAFFSVPGGRERQFLERMTAGCDQQTLERHAKGLSEKNILSLLEITFSKVKYKDSRYCVLVAAGMHGGESVENELRLILVLGSSFDHWVRMGAVTGLGLSGKGSSPEKQGEIVEALIGLTLGSLEDPGEMSVALRAVRSIYMRGAPKEALLRIHRNALNALVRREAEMFSEIEPYIR